jgi:hypothetical protein
MLGLYNLKYRIPLETEGESIYVYTTLIVSVII